MIGIRSLSFLSILTVGILPLANAAWAEPTPVGHVMRCLSPVPIGLFSRALSSSRYQASATHDEQGNDGPDAADGFIEVDFRDASGVRTIRGIGLAAEYEVQKPIGTPTSADGFRQLLIELYQELHFEDSSEETARFFAGFEEILAERGEAAFESEVMTYSYFVRGEEQLSAVRLERVALWRTGEDFTSRAEPLRIIRGSDIVAIRSVLGEVVSDLGCLMIQN